MNTFTKHVVNMFTNKKRNVHEHVVWVDKFMNMFTKLVVFMNTMNCS